MGLWAALCVALCNDHPLPTGLQHIISTLSLPAPASSAIPWWSCSTRSVRPSKKTSPCCRRRGSALARSLPLVSSPMKGQGQPAGLSFSMAVLRNPTPSAPGTPEPPLGSSDTPTQQSQKSSSFISSTRLGMGQDLWARRHESWGSFRKGHWAWALSLAVFPIIPPLGATGSSATPSRGLPPHSRCTVGRPPRLSTPWTVCVQRMPTPPGWAMRSTFLDRCLQPGPALPGPLSPPPWVGDRLGSVPLCLCLVLLGASETVHRQVEEGAVQSGSWGLG